MAMAINNPTKVAINTWGLGHNMCPMSPSRLPLAILPLSGKMVHEQWQTATYPVLGHPWFPLSKVRMHGDIPYWRRVHVPFANRP